MKKPVLIYVLFAFLSAVVLLPGSTVGMELSNEQIQVYEQDKSFIYPNPVKDFLYLELRELDPAFINQSDLRLEIRNILGNVMPLDMERIDQEKYRINASTYPDGYYLLTVYCNSCSDQEQLKNTFKFLKQ